VLLGGILPGDPGWQVWPRTVASRTPEEVQAQVAASGLRGRGGAGFSVAAKWAAARCRPGTVVVANGDEGDPGSFADRLLMEEDPDRVVEGLALACFACGAREAVVLVRSEYPRALARLTARIGHQTPPGQVFCAIHFPTSGVNALTSDHADTVTACPEYKITAVRLLP
jgi:bidirectional [NiFe] hydrogenase diaphorase subunit